MLFTLEYLESACSFKRKFKRKFEKIYPSFYYYTLFFIRTSKFCLRLAVRNFFFIFGAEMFLIRSYFPD